MQQRPGFENFWREIAPIVRAAVVRHPSRDAALAADDIEQEVRIRVWKVYCGDRKNRLGTSYYYRVINSAIIDALRAWRGTLAHAQRAEENELGDPLTRIDSEQPTPDEAIERSEKSARLMARVDGLPDAQRRAVALFLQGFTVPEIAELTGCDENRAHNLTYRGIRLLKQRMKPE